MFNTRQSECGKSPPSVQLKTREQTDLFYCLLMTTDERIIIAGTRCGIYVTESFVGIRRRARNRASPRKRSVRGQHLKIQEFTRSDRSGIQQLRVTIHSWPDGHTVQSTQQQIRFPVIISAAHVLNRKFPDNFFSSRSVIVVSCYHQFTSKR